MARIAKGRDRVLTRAEIATETLRQFDESPEAPSIRALAAALGVAPSAIYHHYESQAGIVQAATELVWEEVARVHGEVFGEIRPATSIVEVAKLIDAAALIEIEADLVLD